MPTTTESSRSRTRFFSWASCFLIPLSVKSSGRSQGWRCEEPLPPAGRLRYPSSPRSREGQGIPTPITEILMRATRASIILVTATVRLFAQDEDFYPHAGLPPEGAARAMTLPGDFKATLFAGEPD